MKKKLLILAVLQLTIVVVQLPELTWAIPNGPYCAAQMALATQSCSVAVPRTHIGNYSITSAEDDHEDGPAPAPPRDSLVGDEHRHKPHRRARHHHRDEEEEDHDHDHEHEREGEDEDENENENERNHSHREGERSLFDNCCRWLKELDSVCICDHLTQLPLVLSRLKHSYVIEVNTDCKVTFHCDV